MRQENILQVINLICLKRVERNEEILVKSVTRGKSVASRCDIVC